MFYSSSIQEEMKKFYNSLSEKDKRRYAAIEAQKLGWGGRKSIFSTQVGIDEAFLEVLKSRTAGDPMNESIKWTNLT